MTTRNLKWIIGGLFLLVLLVGFYWKYRSHGKPLGEVFVGEQNVIVWNTTAQVRQRVTQVHWGEQLETISKSGGMVKVRTLGGLEGWVDGRMLLDAGAWQKEAKLFSQAKSMPVQATGRTKVFTNMRIEAGREAPRIYQLPGGVRVSIVGHAAANAPPAPKGSNPSAGKDDSQRREDWILVVVQTAPAAPSQSLQSQPAQPSSPQSQQPGAAPSAEENAGSSPAPSGPANVVTGNSPLQSLSEGPGGRGVPPIAGWVLARFVELDLPQTLRDYATSAGMRPVAWFVLNHVAEKPQYLVAGVQGAEGQTCDFSLIRVYTWDNARRRYETAYVESDFCGYFPIRAGQQGGKGDPEFRFTALDTNEPKQERVYAMHQTTVRRVRGPAATPPKSH